MKVIQGTLMVVATVALVFWIVSIVAGVWFASSMMTVVSALG